MNKTNLDESFLISAFGVTAQVRCFSNALLERLKNDFACFTTEAAASIDIKFTEVLAIPQPAGKPNAHWKKISFYQKNGHVYIDYIGAKISGDFRAENFEFCGDNMDRVHEVVYLGLLSRMGKRLDLLGYHKVHAFAALIDQTCVVGIGPSGIGKSTLLFSVLECGGNLLSDDIPLFQGANLFAFPLRIATNHENSRKDFSFILQRRNYGRKKLFSAQPYFQQNWGPHRSPQILILKRGAFEPIIKPCSRMTLFGYLLLYLVIGLGTPMVMELFWEPGFKDFNIKLRIFISRLITATKITLQAQSPACFYLSDNSLKNFEYLKKTVSKS